MDYSMNKIVVFRLKIVLLFVLIGNLANLNAQSQIFTSVEPTLVNTTKMPKNIFQQGDGYMTSWENIDEAILINSSTATLKF